MQSKDKDESIKRSNFSQEELAWLKSRLAEVGIGKNPCEVCGNNGWLFIHRPTSTTGVFWRENGVIMQFMMGASQFALCLICSNCSNMKLFDLQTLGFFKEFLREEVEE